MKAIFALAALGASALLSLPAAASDFGSDYESGSAFNDMWGAASASGNTGWTGSYVGLSVGYGNSQTQATVSNPYLGLAYSSPDITTDGVTFGAYGGYNYQYQDMVFGGEITATYLDQTYQSDSLVLAESEWQFTFGIRGGYLIQSNTLLFLKAAWALTDIKLKNLDLAVANEYSVNDGYRSAFQLGGGIESKLDANWLLRLEADYTFEGGEASITDLATGSSVKLDPALFGVNLGLAYQF